jgi:hypothetical protein
MSDAASVSNVARTRHLKEMKQAILARIQPGDKVERKKGRQDTFLGLFEYSGRMFSTHGWYATFEFTEARGHRTKSHIGMYAVLKMLGIDPRTLEPTVPVPLAAPPDRASETA